MTSLTSLFKKPTVKETVRASQREIRSGVRDIDREVAQLKREEEKLLREIKAAAKHNNQAVLRTLAKSLVRVRGQIAKLQGSSAQLRGVSSNLTTTAASTTVAGAVGQASKVMGAMNKQMDPAKMNKTMQQFAKENAKLDMTGEMVGDTIDDALGFGEEEEGEAGELVDQVLDEIGIDLSTQMGAAPRQRVAQAAPSATAAEAADQDALMARLAGLKS